MQSDKQLAKFRNGQQAMSDTGETGRDAADDMQDLAQCEKMKGKALEQCPVIAFMFEKLEELGCRVPDRAAFVSCQPCDDKLTGGFNTEDNHIVLCQNLPKAMRQQQVVDHTLIHELVHAYDQCRAHVQWGNCEHHACSEIRAAGLSGECDWKQEFNRGNINLAGQHQKCVRRRAELSLMMNPSCCQGTKPKEAVDAVFDRCYADTAPFEKRM